MYSENYLNFWDPCKKAETAKKNIPLDVEFTNKVR